MNSTSKANRRPASNASSNEGKNNNSSSNISNNRSKKRAHSSRTSTACEACKKRKTKCSGVQPCELCVTLATECKIDYSLDMRRRSAMQRALAETKDHQETFEALLDILRGDDHERLNEVIEFVQRQSSTSLAATALRDSIFTVQLIDQSSAAPPSVSTAEAQSVDVAGFADASSTSASSLTGAAVLLLQRFCTQWPPDVPGQLRSPSSTHDLRAPHIVEQDAIRRRRWHPSLRLPDRLDFSESVFMVNLLSESPSNTSSDFPSAFGTFHPHHLQDSIEVRLPLPYSESGDGLPRSEHFPCFVIPIHLVQPHAFVDDSVLARVYTDFLRACRHMIQQGKSTADLISGSEITVDLLYRARREDEQVTACSWASELVRGMHELDEFMRLGWVVLLCSFMRWLLMPTAETYANLPEMIKPTCAQRLISHAAGIDICPIPFMRELLVNQHSDWLTALIESHVSVNWPHGREGALEKSLEGHLQLSKRFKLHVREYGNWSVTSRILDWFPQMKGRIRIDLETEAVVQYMTGMTSGGYGAEAGRKGLMKAEEEDIMKYVNY